MKVPTFDALQAAYDSISEPITTRIANLKAALDAGQAISDEDADFMDQAGNLVDEHSILEDLRGLSGKEYQRKAEQLSRDLEEAWDHLVEHAPKDKKKKKKKRTVSESDIEVCSPPPAKKFLTEKVIVAAKKNAADLHTKKRPQDPKKRAEKTDKTKIEVQPVFTKKERATLAQKIEILDFLKTSTQTKTAAHFDRKYPNLQIKQPLVSDWAKNEKQLRETHDKADSYARTAKRLSTLEAPLVDKALSLWANQSMEAGLHLTGEVLRQQWKIFADKMDDPVAKVWEL